jgi:hypothetical protein
MYKTLQQTEVIGRYFRSAFFLKAGLITLFVFFILSKAGVVTGFIPTVLALVWILYVPFGIGYAFLALPLRRVQGLSNIVNSAPIVNIFVKWCVGFFVILLVAFALSWGHLKIENFLGPLFLLISISAYFIGSHNKLRLKSHTRTIKILVISLILGISFGLYVRSFSPYPLSPGIDTFAHIYVIKTVLNGTISTASLAYLPSFDVLLALGSTTFNADLVQLFWTGSIMLFCLFAISLYAMSYWITKNYLAALLASIIGLSVTEMGLAQNLQFLYPSSFVMSIFPVTFLVVHAIWNKSTTTGKKLPIILTIIIFSTLVLIHYELGLVAALILLLYIVMHRITKNCFFFLIVRIATMFIAIIILLYLWGYLADGLKLPYNFVAKMIDYSYIYNVSTKIMDLNQWYTYQITSISLFGLIALSFFKDRRAVVLGFLASIIFLIYFQQIAAIHRIMTLERPLLSLSAAILIMLPVSIVFKTSNQKEKISTRKDHVSVTQELRSKLKMSKILRWHITAIKSDRLAFLTLSRSINRTSIIYVVVIIILLFPVLMKPYDIYMKAYSEHGLPFVNFNTEELAAANWIEKNTPRNYVIFSDPSTVIEMMGLSFRDNIPGIGWNLTVAKLVQSVMTDQTASEAYNKIVSNYGEKVLIVITPRTSEWIRNSGDLNGGVTPSSYFVPFPLEKLRIFNGFDKFFNTEYFKLEYQSNDIFVFTPTHNPFHI